MRGIGGDVVFARQRPVDSIDREGHDEPKEHDAPFLVDRRQKGEHGKDRAGGGQQMNGKGAKNGTGHGLIVRLL